VAVKMLGPGRLRLEVVKLQHGIHPHAQHTS
jgi:hypothetical protein